MAAELLSSVFAGGEVYPPGTAETAELRKLITNPAAWSGPADALAEEPPRSGAGASAAAWRTFAQKLNQAVPTDAGRDAIIDQLVDAGLIGKE